MHRKKHLWCVVMIVLITAFDQLTKFFAQKYLSDGEVVPFIKGIVQFRYAENNGMAFSLFSGARWVFIAVTVIACAAAMWYMFSNRCKSLWLYWSLGVVVSGGIGNLIDRAFYGFVVDFIADCAVTLGAISLFLCLLFSKEEKNE